MDVSRDDLVMPFRDLSDEELLSRLRARTLTPLAVEVVSTELRTRGIEPSLADESEAPHVLMRLRDLSNRELLSRLRAGTLTPRAIEVVSTELRARGVDPSPADESAAPDDAQNVPLAGDLVT